MIKISFYFDQRLLRTIKTTCLTTVMIDWLIDWLIDCFCLNSYFTTLPPRPLIPIEALLGMLPISRHPKVTSLNTSLWKKAVSFRVGVNKEIFACYIVDELALGFSISCVPGGSRLGSFCETGWDPQSQQNPRPQRLTEFSTHKSRFIFQSGDPTKALGRSGSS